MRRTASVLVSTLLVCLGVGAAGARAVVVNVSGVGSVGVALVPRTCSDLTSSNPTCAALRNIGISTATTSGRCKDPALAPDLGGPFLANGALCYRGGPVLHRNETIAEVWSPRPHSDYASTYVEQFLRDVADGSGTMMSPYAVTPQYTDAAGRAGNASLYGGGYQSGTSYPASGCAPSGVWHNYVTPNDLIDVKNDVCLTYAQLQDELRAMVAQEGLIGRIQKGYSPLLVLLTPPGVETCLDAAQNLCSANGKSQVQFCSYHSQIAIGGTQFSYVVQPWSLGFPRPVAPSVTAEDTGGDIPKGTYQVEVTYLTADGETLPSPPATVGTNTDTSTIKISVSPPKNVKGWYLYMTGADSTTFTRIGGLRAPDANEVVFDSLPDSSAIQPPLSAGCDDPSVPPLPHKPTPDEVAADAGARLASPLSQSHIAAIVNPTMNGWVARDGGEIDDNWADIDGFHDGCQALPDDLDLVEVASHQYYLQREFNNGWLIANNPFALGCESGVVLEPQFILPNPVDAGDVVKFDASGSPTTLRIPRAGFVWSFGDGQSAVGPAVVHRYAKGGSYSVKLTVTDRGGYVASLSQTINVLGSSVHPPAPTVRVALRLLPQSLHSVLRNGVAVQVSSNVAASGMATIAIPSGAATRAHIGHGRGSSVVIARGTVAGIAAGTAKLHLRMANGVAQKLGHLSHVKLTVRMALVTAGGGHITVVAAGNY